MTEHDASAIQAIHRDLRDHLPSDPALRVKALESVLVAKGLIDPATVERWIQVYAEEIGPKRGAAIVARAWCDPAFKARLLADAAQAIEGIGYEGWASAHLKAVENSDRVHNVVVCTLCSCYPISVLGLPPAWYKSAPYRARIVRDPRGVLKEFGVTLADDIEVRVWDSTAELRYLVVPGRPKGTEGWSAERLAAIVTRDAMIGTERDLDIAKARG
jgi:nitrile hydratase